VTVVRGRARGAVRGPVGVLGLVLLVVLVALVYVLHRRTAQLGELALPLRTVAQTKLPGSTSRFDYASLDPVAHRLFIAHLGDSELLTLDTTTNQVVRRTAGLAAVHGVLVVPALHRVYATATGTNQLVALDETSGAELWRAPTGSYPDGIAYAPTTGQLWVSNEDAGGQSVVDAATGRVVGSVPLGGEAGNVAVDPGASGGSAAVLVDVQTSNEVLRIDPVTRRVLHRTALPGCQHDHGLAILPAQRLAFIACDGNAVLEILDLTSGRISQHIRVGRDPDVLAVDPTRGTVLVAAESGLVTTLHVQGRRVQLTGRAPLAGGAHVVAVDTGTGQAYWPLADAHGRPQLLVTAPR